LAKSTVLDAPELPLSCRLAAASSAASVAASLVVIAVATWSVIAALTAAAMAASTPGGWSDQVSVAGMARSLLDGARHARDLLDRT